MTATDTATNVRLAGLTAPQARELRAIATNGRTTGVVGCGRVVTRLVEAGLVEHPDRGYWDVRATEAGVEAIRVLDGGAEYLEERGRRELAAATAQRHADGTTLRHMALAALGSDAATVDPEARTHYEDLRDNPRPATDEELRTFRNLAAGRAVAEGKTRSRLGTRRALAAWAEADAVDAILAERAAATAVELEAHPDDDAADLVNPAGPRVYLRGTVHAQYDTPEVGETACGMSTRGGIDTAAAVTCAACNRELAAIEVEVLEGVLERRRQAEAPASPTLPGIDAAIVEADLGAGLAQVLPEVLVVVPCSAAKLDHSAPAGELYTGTLHKAARAAADALVERIPGARVVILSALHGLTELDEVLEPYDVTVGDPQAFAVAMLARQLTRRHVRRVVALTPRSYTDLLARAAAIADVELETPLAGSRGIGEQRGRLRRLRTGELTLAV